ncbi:helix-turn-helix transcriptional regulator [Metaclostridioides mangenotii]|uniref:helix-turn-helix transcriptional regulator n=1 Tax=Metaclostridioides mangenotii TaxID=1540 RepID=UPI0004802121|nr:YafY family protein [Clostridioides mangenotii]
MQISRLFQIVYILLDRKTITAKELADRFEVSVRTIYRDINTLGTAGIPIYTSQGRGGGISILDDYVLNKSLLSDDEQKEILIGLQSLKAANYPDIKILDKKLGALFSKNKQSWIEVDFSHWGSGNEEKDKFQILKNSVLNKNTVEFSYSNSNGEQTTRQIEPLKLIFKNKSWYVSGFCLLKNQFRIFKISRISNLNSTEIFFDRDLPDDLVLIKEKTVGYKASNIVLKFSNHISYRVYDEFNINDIEIDADGNLIVSLSYPEDEWLYGYILSFGFYVEVIEPQGLRDVISNKISKMMNIYN